MIVSKGTAHYYRGQDFDSATIGLVEASSGSKIKSRLRQLESLLSCSETWEDRRRFGAIERGDGTAEMKKGGITGFAREVRVQMRRRQGTAPVVGGRHGNLGRARADGDANANALEEESEVTISATRRSQGARERKRAEIEDVQKKCCGVRRGRRPSWERKGHGSLAAAGRHEACRRGG